MSQRVKLQYAKTLFDLFPLEQIRGKRGFRIINDKCDLNEFPNIVKVLQMWP